VPSSSPRILGSSSGDQVEVFNGQMHTPPLAQDGSVFPNFANATHAINGKVTLVSCPKVNVVNGA